MYSHVNMVKVNLFPKLIHVMCMYRTISIVIGHGSTLYSYVQNPHILVRQVIMAHSIVDFSPTSKLYSSSGIRHMYM